MPEYRAGLGDDPGRTIKLPHGYMEWRHAPGNTVEIVNLEVENGYKRQGIGRELMRILMEQSYLPADFLVYVLTSMSNRPAQRFYQAMGFEAIGTLLNLYPDSNAIAYGRKVGDKL